jgi:hypothetical protein
MAKKIRRVKSWIRSGTEKMFIASILLRGRITASAAEYNSEQGPHATALY